MLRAIPFLTTKTHLGIPRLRITSGLRHVSARNLAYRLEKPLETPASVIMALLLVDQVLDFVLLFGVFLLLLGELCPGWDDFLLSLYVVVLGNRADIFYGVLSNHGADVVSLLEYAPVLFNLLSLGVGFSRDVVDHGGLGAGRLTE